MNEPTQTQMTNPPTKETKMVSKKVKIKTLQPIRIDDGSRDPNVIQPGTEVEVTDEQASEFCDKVFKGYHNFEGERSEKQAPRSEIRRAVRV